MDWLKTIAPTIATALGGPLAGLAIEAVSKAIGIDPKDVQSTISEGKLSSDQIMLLKQAEIQMAARAQEMGLDFAKLSNEDRKSARDMQAATKSKLVPFLAIVIVMSFIGVVISTLAGATKVESVLAGTLIGYLSAKAEQVIAFYFGSSAGSQKKDELLHNSTPAK